MPSLKENLLALQQAVGPADVDALVTQIGEAFLCLSHTHTHPHTHTFTWLSLWGLSIDFHSFLNSFSNRNQNSIHTLVLNLTLDPQTVLQTHTHRLQRPLLEPVDSKPVSLLDRAGSAQNQGTQHSWRRLVGVQQTVLMMVAPVNIRTKPPQSFPEQNQLIKKKNNSQNKGLEHLLPPCWV
uniref:Uncharacterized protein n=1 Tax=Xiphophorus couchianus TaxID=32473 RepID=A0A3B5KQA1_9TELE